MKKKKKNSVVHSLVETAWNALYTLSLEYTMDGIRVLFVFRLKKEQIPTTNCFALNWKINCGYRQYRQSNIEKSTAPQFLFFFFYRNRGPPIFAIRQFVTTKKIRIYYTQTKIFFDQLESFGAKYTPQILFPTLQKTGWPPNFLISPPITTKKTTN